MNNHRKDVKDPKHFLKNGHRFNKHAGFTIIDRLTNANQDKQIIRECLFQGKTFWTQKLETLYPKGQKPGCLFIKDITFDVIGKIKDMSHI